MSNTNKSIFTNVDKPEQTADKIRSTMNLLNDAKADMVDLTSSQISPEDQSGINKILTGFKATIEKGQNDLAQAKNNGANQPQAIVTKMVSDLTDKVSSLKAVVSRNGVKFSQKAIKLIDTQLTVLEQKAADFDIKYPPAEQAKKSAPKNG